MISFLFSVLEIQIDTNHYEFEMFSFLLYFTIKSDMAFVSETLTHLMLIFGTLLVIISAFSADHRCMLTTVGKLTTLLSKLLICSYMYVCKATLT